MSQPATAGDPVFAAAERAAARQHEYRTQSDHYHQQFMRLVGPPYEAASFAIYGPISDEEFARRWAVELLNAGRTVIEAGLPELLTDDPALCMPGRLARAALRAAKGGLADVEHAAGRIVANMEFRVGVRGALRTIADEFSKRLRERHESELVEQFPDLATDGVATPMTDPLERTEQLARAAGVLEKLAGEFRDLGEELRGRLNTVLLSSDRWDALFDVGPHIPRTAYEKTSIQRFAAEGGTTPSGRAQYAKASLIECAMRRDRTGFDSTLARMRRAHPDALAIAEKSFPDDIRYLLIGLYRSRGAEFRQRADAILAPLGMHLMETHTVDVIRHAGIPFSREAEFTLNYWFDLLFGQGVWFDRCGEQLLPFGPFPPLVAAPQGESESSEEGQLTGPPTALSPNEGIASPLTAKTVSEAVPPQAEAVRPIAAVPSTCTPPNGTQQCEVGKPLAVTQADRPARDPDRPSLNRQSDIIGTIRSKGTPLQRSELLVAMKMKTLGKMATHLAWMVRNRKLINIEGEGYWPADDPLPGTESR